MIDHTEGQRLLITDNVILGVARGIWRWGLGHHIRYPIYRKRQWHEKDKVGTVDLDGAYKEYMGVVRSVSCSILFGQLPVDR